MLKGRNSVRVIVLAALVLAVALSSTLGNRLSLGRATAATTTTKQSHQRAVQQERLNSAWQTQISDEQTLLQKAQQEQQAQQQAASAAATLAPPSAAAVQADIQAAFGPLGSKAVQWGLCTAQHESDYNASAIQIGGGPGQGLFQFEPETWAGTPQGKAGESPFDPVAASQAAAAFYAAGNYDAWTTNAAYCSMYD